MIILLTLQQDCHRSKILIWGEAGVGKSTFCETICHDWALVITGRDGTELDKLTEEQRRMLNNIGLLFCIVLRDTNSDQTLEQILTSQFDLLDQQLDILKSFFNNVTLILDGLDELSYFEGDIQKLIQGELYQNIQYIITCRPYTSQAYVPEIDSEIRLKGFLEAESRTFVEMFARMQFQNENDIDLFISKTWKEITSSVDLIEMSTNPSMLQLMCFLSAETGKIGKDRVEIFKHCVNYLLLQYHAKYHQGVPYSDDLYKDALLICGTLAISGLKYNYLQVIFSIQEAQEIAGTIVFDIGFLTELPSIYAEKGKVQFIHKYLQEYLAAYYVVNTSLDEGMKVLMEFCSTSQRLMGSQNILSFIIAMSKKMGKVIQNQIRDYISTWASNDDVDPKSRTSFLITMLKDNNSLTFPLPAILDIDLQDNDSFSKRFMNFFWSLFGQKSTLELFLNMDARGVKKLNIHVGQYNRLSLFLNNLFTSLEELLVNYRETWSNDDPKHLTQLITTNKPKLISITGSVFSLFNKDLITKVILTPQVHTVILKKCQISKDNCLLILQKGQHLKALVIQDCGIQIDADTAKAVGDLPDEIQVDLSGNKIHEMDTKIISSLIYRIRIQKEIDLSGLNINIDREIVKCISQLPEDVQIDLSDNKITDESLIVSIIKQSTKLKSVTLRNCGIKINKQIAEAVSELNDDTKLDLSGNEITKMEAGLLGKVLKYMKELEEINICGWRMIIYVDIIKALSNMTSLTSLNISHNLLTLSACKCLVQSARLLPHLQDLRIGNCGISNDECVNLVYNLSLQCSKLELLYLYNNNLSSGVSQVLDDVRKMKNLRRLWLFGNPCTKDSNQSEEIKNRLKKTNPRLKVWTF